MRGSLERPARRSENPKILPPFRPSCAPSLCGFAAWRLSLSSSRIAGSEEVREAQGHGAHLIEGSTGDVGVAGLGE